MPKGPNGEKRPADVNACAVHVMRIATGEIDEATPRAPGRVKSGKVGGPARAKALSASDRQKIAKLAALARWDK